MTKEEMEKYWNSGGIDFLKNKDRFYNFDTFEEYKEEILEIEETLGDEISQLEQLLSDKEREINDLDDENYHLRQENNRLLKELEDRLDRMDDIGNENI